MYDGIILPLLPCRVALRTRYNMNLLGGEGGGSDAHRRDHKRGRHNAVGASTRICVFLCRRRANPKRAEGSPIWETLHFSDHHPMRADALRRPDHLSNLVPSTTRFGEIRWKSRTVINSLEPVTPRRNTCEVAGYTERAGVIIHCVAIITMCKVDRLSLTSGATAGFVRLKSSDTCRFSCVARQADYRRHKGRIIPTDAHDF